MDTRSRSYRLQHVATGHFTSLQILNGCGKPSLERWEELDKEKEKREEEREEERE